jgi:hypothetical protein
LVGAGVIAVAPVAPLPSVQVPEIRVPAVQLTMPEVQLTASIVDIFRFPAFQQYIVNQIGDLARLGVGLGVSAAGLGAAIVAIPQLLATLTQQVLSGQLQEALTTIEEYLIESAGAVVLPTLGAIITNRQRVLAVQSALQVAVPTAIVQFGAGIGDAIDGVVRAFITAGQLLVDAALPLDLGNLVDALVTGTAAVLGSFGQAGQDVVDGIVAAQNTIATAFAQTPPSDTLESRTAAFTAGVTTMPNLSGGSVATFNLEPSTPLDTDPGDALSSDLSGGDLTTLTVTPPSDTPDADEEHSTPKFAVTSRDATPSSGFSGESTSATGDPSTTSRVSKLGSTPVKRATERARDWLKKRDSLSKRDSLPKRDSLTKVAGVDSEPQSPGTTEAGAAAK